MLDGSLRDGIGDGMRFAVEGRESAAGETRVAHRVFARSPWSLPGPRLAQLLVAMVAE